MKPITAADVLRGHAFSISKELASWIDKSVEEAMPQWCRYLVNRYPYNKFVGWMVRTFSGVEVRIISKDGGFGRVYQVCSWGIVVAQLEVE